MAGVQYIFCVYHYHSISVVVMSCFSSVAGVQCILCVYQRCGDVLFFFVAGVQYICCVYQRCGDVLFFSVAGVLCILCVYMGETAPSIDGNPSDRF